MKDGGSCATADNSDKYSNDNEEDDDSLTGPYACVACGWVGSLGQECIMCGEDSCCYCLDAVSYDD